MYNLAVIGNPIAHSLSPLVFAAFAKQFNLSINYNKILAHNDNDFTSKVSEFFAAGGMALSITSPFKHQAYAYAQANATPRAHLTKSTNLLYSLHKQHIIADTTDGIGFVTDVECNNRYSLYAKNILLIGSGYVVDAILADIITKNPAQVHILARNTVRCDDLVNKFGVGIYQDNCYYDMVINTTPNIESNTLFTQVKHLADNALCYDLGYSTRMNYFYQTLANINSQITSQNGLGMLVEQAKIVFKRIFDLEPNTQIVIDELRQNALRTC